MIDDARAALRRASWGDTKPWTTQKPRCSGAGAKLLLTQLKTNLIAMAIAGCRMYDTFTRELVGALPNVQKLQQLMRTPNRVEIALKSSSRFVVPAALLYDYSLDTNLEPSTYKLCPYFCLALDQALPLENRSCFLGKCPNSETKEVVCPSGFWGFRHQIGLPMSESNDSSAASEIEYEGVPKLTICVSTDAALIERQSRLQTIHDFDPDMGWNYAQSRKQVLDALKQEADLVYFYCHGGLFGENKPYPSVGAKDEMGITPDNLGSYGIYWEEPRPLVVINGCHTTDVAPEVALNFVATFIRTSHASGVIGTEITVFEPEARDFAEGFLRRFLERTPVGEAMRTARLAMLKAGNPLGLVCIPFALANLSLERNEL